MLRIGSTDGGTVPGPAPAASVVGRWLRRSIVATSLLLTGVTRASPPPELPASAEIAGMWLSLELIGPRGAQIEAAESLRSPPIVGGLPRGGAPPPGEIVGRVESLEQALQLVEQHAFEGGAIGSGEDHDVQAPYPGGALLREHGVHLTALVLTGASPSGGTIPFAWPHASELPTPASWLPASLAVARAPLFAAPSPSLPPASERYREVTIGDALWQLGAIERCSPSGACLRWAQILVRQGDRWFGGWLPASQVVADREWIAGPDERRFALIASHRDRAKVGFVLVEQRGARRQAPRGISQVHVGSSWPSATLQILGEQLIVLVDKDPALTLALPPVVVPQTTQPSE